MGSEELLGWCIRCIVEREIEESWGLWGLGFGLEVLNEL